MPLIDWLINGILAFIMLSVGLSLSVRHFGVTFGRPRAYILGLVLQLIWLPLIAMAVVAVGPLPDYFRIGIVILAACPGGMTSNFISYLMGANAALSIALTVTNSLIALVSVPFIVNLALRIYTGEDTTLHLPFWNTMRQIFMITIVPVGVGLLIRHRWPKGAGRLENKLKYVTVVLLGILFTIKFFASESQGGTGISMQDIAQILPYSVVVNVLALSSGYFFGRMFQLDTNNQLTLGVEVGIQNTSLAFLIAGNLLGNEEMLKPALVYALFTFMTAILYSLILKPAAVKRIKKLWKKP